MTSIRIDGTRYAVGGRLYRVNQWNQGFYGEIVAVHDDRPNGRPLLKVRRDDGGAEEWISPGDYVRTRYWHPARA